MTREVYLDPGELVEVVVGADKAMHEVYKHAPTNTMQERYSVSNQHGDTIGWILRRHGSRDYYGCDINGKQVSDWGVSTWKRDILDKIVRA